MRRAADKARADIEAHENKSNKQQTISEMQADEKAEKEKMAKEAKPTELQVAEEEDENVDASALVEKAAAAQLKGSRRVPLVLLAGGDEEEDEQGGAGGKDGAESVATGMSQASGATTRGPGLSVRAADRRLRKESEVLVAEAAAVGRELALARVGTQAACRTLYALARSQALSVWERQRVLRAVVALGALPDLLSVLTPGALRATYGREEQARREAVAAVRQANQWKRLAHEGLSGGISVNEARRRMQRASESKALARAQVRNAIAAADARRDDEDTQEAAVMLVGALVPRFPVVEEEEDAIVPGQGVIGEEAGVVAQAMAAPGAETSAKEGGTLTVATPAGEERARTAAAKGLGLAGPGGASVSGMAVSRGAYTSTAATST